MMLSSMVQCLGGGCSNGSPQLTNLKILDNACQSLSREELEVAVRDYYGVEEPIQETPEFLDRKQKELRYEIEKLNDATKRFYNHALAMEQKRLQQKQGVKEEAYVSSSKFHLMFLRAERFHCQKAALRITRYFQEKSNLFGEDKLHLRIRLSDLSVFDRAAISHGLFCGFTSYDSAGRLVIFQRRPYLLNHDVLSSMRAMFYIIQTIMHENELAQTKGVVIVAYNLGVLTPTSGVKMRHYAPIAKLYLYALPCKTAGHHLLFNDIKDQIVANIMAVIYPKEVRVRIHRHYVETHPACLWLLATFGINPSAMPFQEDGTCNREEVLNWMEEQRQKES